MKYLRAFISFLVECNLFIAFAAVCYTVQAQIQLGLPITWHPYLFLIFSATLLEYNLSRFFAILTRRQLLTGTRYAWINRNLHVFNTVMFLSIAGFLLTCLFAKKEVLIALFPLGVLTLLYAFPFYGKGNVRVRLRDIPFVKIFIISLIWSTTTVLLPVIQSGQSFEALSVSMLITERFLFIFAITIPFDIRDMKNDLLAGIKTIPLFFGKQKALHFAYFALAVFAVLSIFIHDGSERIALLSSVVITLFALSIRKWQSSVYYYYLLLDGMIVVQAGLVILAYYL